MRANFAKVLVVAGLATTVSGCKSNDMFAWWSKKKPDNTAVANGPTVTTGTPALPSAGINPTASMNTVQGSGSLANTAGAKSPTMPGAYNASPAAFQMPSTTGYPTTPYGQAKLTTPGATPATGPAPTTWNTGAAATGAANPLAGYNAATNMPGGAMASTAAARGVGTAGYGVTPPASAMPSYGGVTATTAPTVQPQSGPYNPTYDGGGVNRYASGAAIPGASAAAYPGSYPAAAPATNTAPPDYSVPNYRTADARATGTPAAGGDAGSFAPSAVGDRYATPATVSPSGSNLGDRYSQPLNSPNPTGYEPGNTGYTPGAGTVPVGSTSYNPPDVYSTTGATAAAAASLPARKEPNYRPGGTSSYLAPTGTTVQPSTSGPSASPSSAGVTPASYQSDSTRSAWASPAIAVAPADSSSNESYGSYQGTGSTLPSNPPPTMPRGW